MPASADPPYPSIPDDLPVNHVDAFRRGWRSGWRARDSIDALPREPEADEEPGHEPKAGGDTRG